MGNNMSLETLKSHLFETLEGLKNQNDPEASENEKVSLPQAKAIVGVANSIIDIYKVQVDAIRIMSGMDVANPETLIAALGVTDKDNLKQLQ